MLPFGAYRPLMLNGGTDGTFTAYAPQLMDYIYYRSLKESTVKHQSGGRKNPELARHTRQTVPRVRN